jgi:PAS domain S-box-containing protein
MSFDALGRFTSWNPAAERLFGYSTEEAIGRGADLLLTKLPAIPDGETARGAFDAALSGQRVQKETQRATKDGTIIDVSVTASPILAPDGSVTGVSAIMRDIGERKKADEARSRLAGLRLDRHRRHG